MQALINFLKTPFRASEATETEPSPFEASIRKQVKSIEELLNSDDPTIRISEKTWSICEACMSCQIADKEDQPSQEAFFMMAKVFGKLIYNNDLNESAKSHLLNVLSDTFADYKIGDNNFREALLRTLDPSTIAKIIEESIFYVVSNQRYSIYERSRQIKRTSECLYRCDVDMETKHFDLLPMQFDCSRAYAWAIENDNNLLLCQLRESMFGGDPAESKKTERAQ